MATKVKPYGLSKAKRAIKGKKGKALKTTVGGILKKEGRPAKKRMSAVTVTRSSNKPMQTKTGKARDRKRVAMPAGKRLAKTGAKRKHYYERRKNRSDNLGTV